MVTAVCGANAQDLELAGKTVSQVRQELKDVLNIGEDSNAIISGDNVENDYVLRDGDVLEFVKRSGTKGKRQ